MSDSDEYAEAAVVFFIFFVVNDHAELLDLVGAIVEVIRDMRSISDSNFLKKEGGPAPFYDPSRKK